MESATVTVEGDHQTVRLPRSIHLPPTVFVRQDGDSVVLEPAKAKTWPEGFFDSIHVTDGAFERPAQGQPPTVKNLWASLPHLLDTDTCIGVLRQQTISPSATTDSATPD
jgi:virulence-associated protein VagC